MEEKLSNLVIGKITELNLAGELLKRGWCTSMPLHDMGYDVIATMGERVLRIQVKSTRHKESGYRYRALITHGSKAKKKYTIEHADLIAVYIVPEKLWYFIPIDKIVSSTVKLYPTGKNGKYEQYRDNWEVFIDKKKVKNVA